MKLVNALLAANVRKLREEKNFTIAQLADQSGVSKSMLAQIERGEANPSVGTIWKIANGLHTSFTSLLAEEHQAVKVIHKQDVFEIGQEDGLYKLFSYVPFDNQHRFELYTVELEPECLHESEAHARGVEEYLVVQAGALEITIRGECYKLVEGDAIQFVSDDRHSYKNVYQQVTKYMTLLYYPEPSRI